jgi:hypothetical protein
MTDLFNVEDANKLGAAELRWAQLVKKCLIITGRHRPRPYLPAKLKKTYELVSFVNTSLPVELNRYSYDLSLKDSDGQLLRNSFFPE